MNTTILTAMTPSQKLRSQAASAHKTTCRMTAIAETLSFAIAPTVGGLMVTANSNTDLGVVVGACFAGAGVAAILGMLMSEVLPEYNIPKMTGLKRLTANWLAGLCSIPFVGAVRRKWFAEEDLAIVAGGLSGLFALFGVVVLMMGIPMVLRLLRARAGAIEMTATTTTTQITSQSVTGTQMPAAPTVKLVEDGKGK